ncbi:Tad domain-containing protein [Arthrobacter bambusae]|uniref:Tad domain-containing protein n=1 Tax=Arthrobacter bambusae TaxID=1338426 RepID=UPI0027858628|nr:Tad domain-containing protein [Arthrobacter bambusae]MDQ0031398.1 Flp pilus assembly protein TadG [Arthrobacter bambusae]MDQ0099713.1 Flp pilus assembly protein TadG [Arthrobacter bambusae]
MRRLMASNDDGERGAIAVLVALLLVVLLGFAALAVDVGLLYSERAQVQNGSDAAALAIAQKCAANTSDPNCSTTSPLASDVANKNAIDGLNNVKSINLDLTNRKVTVTGGAQQSGGAPNAVSLFFARVMGVNTSDVVTTSSVQWGSAVAGRTPFPLVYSICQVQGYIGGALQLLQDHGSGANPSCNYGPSGATVAGGFGWIVQDPGLCGGTINLATNEGGSAPGNSTPGNCAATLQKWADTITSGRDVVVLLPVFDAVTGTGSGAVYHLVSFAAFKVAGWKFSGNDTLPDSFRNTNSYVSNALACTGNCRGIIGSFVRYVSLADGYSLGPVDAFGATIVRLTN